MAQPAHVLVVDDERFFREAIGEVLDEAGIPHLVADRGSEALALAQDGRLGAVVLDVQLPDMTGLEVFRRLREIRPDLPVIILSAHTDQEYVLEALRLGATDYLAKPIHQEELALAVRRALDLHALSARWSRLRERVRALEGALDRVWANGSADAAARATADLLQATKSSLMLLDESGEQLRVASAWGRELDASQMDPVPVGAGVAGLALQSGEPLVVENVAVDPRFADRDVAGRYATGSFAVAPLRVRERALGVLCVTDRVEEAPFDAEDLALLRILAGQIGRKVARDADAPAAAAEGAPAREAAPEAELVAESESAAEAELVAESDAGDEGDADLARAICEAVTAEVEPSRILQAVLRPVAEALQAAPVALYLVSDGCLRREAEWDGGVRGDRGELPIGRGLTGGVAETGQLVASGEPASDPRFRPEVDTPEDGRAGPLLCVPLRFRGRTLGVLRAFPEGSAVPSARTGEVLGAALSAAVRNVLLYRSLVESIEEVARARREAGHA